MSPATTSAGRIASRRSSSGRCTSCTTASRVNLSSSLSAFLRTVTEVSIVSVEQFAYSEFLMSLPDPTAFYSFAMPPFDGMAALEINPSIAFTMVDRMLGGDGPDAGAEPRAHRDRAERRSTRSSSCCSITSPRRGAPIAELQFRFTDRETRPQMLRVTGPNEIVILLAFELRDRRGARAW